MTVELDPNAVASLLTATGVTFNELYTHGNTLVIGIPDGDCIPVETIFYVYSLVESLGIDAAYIKFRNRYILVSK